MMGRRATWAAAAILLAAATFPACAGGSEDEMDARNESVRTPVVAGTFYPGDPGQLASTIDGYLDAAETAGVSGEVVAVIAPHAGYVYSGAVAGEAYARVAGHAFDSVIVVAPSHRAAFRGASVYDGDAYETPLGRVPVDGALADAIRASGDAFACRAGAHSQEHSLEVQVPFLQRALGEFAIVPIVMGDQSESTVRALAGAIARAVESSSRRVLLVASTDLSHYHEQARANALDQVVIDRVAAFDPEGLLEDLAAGRCEACGGGPMAVVMMVSRHLGADRSDVVRYATSGDTSGDMSQVVGYLAAVLTRSGADGGETSGDVGGDASGDAGEEASGDVGGDASSETREDAGVGSSPQERPYEGLGREERMMLLRFARATVEAAVRGEALPRLEQTTPALRTPCGGFVTLDKRGRLRGCIGYVVAVKPLHETVSDMAVQAALHDPRFPAVTEDELEDIEIEISVLSPLSPVEDPSEIVVGRDGLVIRGRGRSGLLLPQVASERGWDRETFLDQTCVKAGLPPGVWGDPDIAIERFSAEVFSEKELGLR